MKEHFHLFTPVSEAFINCYQSGHWDGLKSDPIIVLTKSGSIYETVVYENIIGGVHTFDYYDNLDCEIVNVTHVLDLSALTTKARATSALDSIFVIRNEEFVKAMFKEKL